MPDKDVRLLVTAGVLLLALSLVNGFLIEAMRVALPRPRSSIGAFAAG